MILAGMLLSPTTQIRGQTELCRGRECLRWLCPLRVRLCSSRATVYRCCLNPFFEPQQSKAISRQVWLSDASCQVLSHELQTMVKPNGLRYVHGS